MRSGVWDPSPQDRKAWTSWVHKSCAAQQGATKYGWLVSAHHMQPADGAQLVESQPSMWVSPGFVASTLSPEALAHRPGIPEIQMEAGGTEEVQCHPKSQPSPCPT